MPDVVLTTGTDNSGVKAGFAELSNQSQRMKAELAGVFAGTFAVAGLSAAVTSLISYGDKIYDLGQRYGVTTDALQKFGNAAEKEGSSLEGVAAGFNKLIIAQSKAVGGSTELQQHFANLGISIDDLKKLSPEEIMLKLGKSSMEAADTVAILGRNGLELRPVLKGLADGTVEFGTAIDAVNIKRLADASDTLKDLGERARIFGAALIGPVLKGLDEVGDAFAELKAIGVGTWNAINAAAHLDVEGFKDAVQSQADALSGKLQEQRQAGRDGTRSRAGGAPDDGGIADSTSSSSRGSGSGGSGGGDLGDRLEKLQREDYLSQLDSLEKIRAIEQERADLQDELTRGRAAGNLSLDDDEKLQTEILQKEGDITKLKNEQNKAQDTYNQKVIEAREAADEELQTSERRNQVLQLTAAGHADIARKLQDEWAAEDKIAEVTDRINQAWSEGNQELAETLTSVREQLEIEKQINTATEARIQLQKDIAEGQRRAREGYGVMPGSDAALRAGAAGIEGVGGTDWDVIEATDEYTGVVDQKKLNDLRRRNEIGALTDQMKFGTGAVQGGSAIPQRTPADVNALKAKLLRLQERQQREAEQRLRDSARDRIRELEQQIYNEQHGTGLGSTPTVPTGGSPGDSGGLIGPTTGGGVGQVAAIPSSSGPFGGLAVNPQLSETNNRLSAIERILQSTQRMIQGPPGSG